MNFLRVLFIPCTVNSVTGEVENYRGGSKGLGLRREWNVFNSSYQMIITQNIGRRSLVTSDRAREHTWLILRV